MKKFSVETGLNKDLIPLIKCSPAYYDQLIIECRTMIKVAIENGRGKFLAANYPAICVLAKMPTVEEGLNKY